MKPTTVNLSDEQDRHLRQLAHQRDVFLADILREAVQEYLDRQADVIGSRLYYHKTMQKHLNTLESHLAFHLNVVLLAVASLKQSNPELIKEALVAARTTDLSPMIAAVRDLESK